MLPAGEPTAHAMLQLADHLQAGDITVDGSDSRYQDAILRRDRLGDRGIDHVDCAAAMSQGMNGYLLMLGGRKSAVGYLHPMLRTAAPEGRECLHCGSNGSAHFVQMVRARVGEATMQSFADGFDLLYHANIFGYELPLNDIAQMWRHDGLISSRTAAATSLYEQVRSEANRSFAEKILSAMRLASGGESMAR
jgi:6-phosphogluconate dehydrogenase